MGLRYQDSVSERLRRWTRNPLGSARRGSNPLAVAFQSSPGGTARRGRGKRAAAESGSTLLIDKRACTISTPMAEAPCSGLFALRLLRSPGWRPCLSRVLASELLRYQDSVSERLRGWTRNPLGSARRGSNPLAVAFQSSPGGTARRGRGGE